MRWQYRTILFEFQKDGLLGDKYIDDEEIEKTLNTQGRAGWELVSVTMSQEGVLAFLKRSEETVRKPAGALERPILKDSGDTGERKITAEELQQQEREHIRNLEQQRRQTMQEQEKDMVGEIKIS